MACRPLVPGVLVFVALCVHATGVRAEHNSGAYIEGKAGSVLLLVGGKVSAMGKTFIRIGDERFGVTSSTRVCNKDGQQATLQAIHVGEQVLVTAKPGANVARTIRPGLMMSRLTKRGDVERVDNYSCL